MRFSICILSLVIAVGGYLPLEPAAAKPKPDPLVLQPRDFVIEQRIDRCQGGLWNLENLILVRTNFLDRTIGNDARLLPEKRVKAQKDLDDTLARYRHITLEPVHQRELARVREVLASVDRQIAEHRSAQRTLNDLRRQLSDVLERKFDIAERLNDFAFAWGQCPTQSPVTASCRAQTLPLLDVSFFASEALLEQASRELPSLGITVPAIWEQNCRNPKVHK